MFKNGEINKKYPHQQQRLKRMQVNNKNFRAKKALQTSLFLLILWKHHWFDRCCHSICYSLVHLSMTFKLLDGVYNHLAGRLIQHCTEQGHSPPW